MIRGIKFPFYVLYWVREKAIPRLHSAEDDVSSLQTIPVLLVIIPVAEVVVAVVICLEEPPSSRGRCC